MWELLAIGAMLAVATAMIVRRSVVIRACCALIVGALPLLALLLPSQQAPELGPADAPQARYTTSNSCRSCHPSQWHTWQQTYHRTMTQRPSATSILPDWSGRLEHQGRTYELLRDGDEFYVDMPAYGTTGQRPEDRRRRPIVLVTGSHNMQLYWVPLPWKGQPEDGRERGRFNQRCSSCHGQNGRGGSRAIELRRTQTIDGVQVHRTQRVTPAPLIDAELTPPELRAAMASRWHRALVPDLKPADRDLALAYAQRLQVRGALQQFPFAWWIPGQRWMPEELTFLQPPEPGRAVERYEQAWSDGCDGCHSVDPRAQWNAKGAQLQAKVGELGVACEACHGPGEAHAARHRDPLTRYSARGDDVAADDIVNPSNLNHRDAAAVCGQCHAELHQHADGPFVVGEAMSSWAHVVQRLDPPYPDWLQQVIDDDPLLLDSAFWRDGTMRVAGRDLNALELSACYQRGEATCTSCHDLHGGSRDDNLAEHARGDAPCVECHPAIAAQGEQHTHHPASSEGARCMNCHMPHTTLGLLGAMRSHRIDSPNATTSLSTGRPDACTLCHLDRPLDWTADALQRWYGQPAPQTAAGTESAAATEHYIRGDAVQRAVIAWHLGWAPAREASGDDWQAAHLAIGLDDPYAAVRFISGSSLRRTPGYEDVQYDYTADEHARQEVARKVLDRWTDRGAQPRPTVWVTPDGLDMQHIETLQMLRDEREVIVSE